MDNGLQTSVKRLAPIAVFVYNRLLHTKQTFEALKRNALAAQSDLIVFCEGGKSANDWENVNEVRRFVKSLSGFRSITTIESDSNKGLARSFIDGISFVTSKYGRGIILEDDNVVALHFLDFMNAALSLYENDASVAAISGYVYPSRRPLPETFFIRGVDGWGFGIWERSWRQFEPDGSKLLREIETRGLADQLDYDNTFPFTKILRDQILGLNDSWAVRWVASAFLNNMMTLFPFKSLVKNTGYDSSGTHCKTSNVYDVRLYEGRITVNRIPLVECVAARKAFIEFHATAFGPNEMKMWQRIKRQLRAATNWMRS